MRKPAVLMRDEPEDLPAPGDPVECWQCGGEGGWDDDDPFCPVGWIKCDICDGQGGWVCEAVE